MNTQNDYIVSTQSNAWSQKIAERIDTIEDAGLNWDVVKTPLVAMLEGRYPLPIENHVSINRTDNNETVGVVGSKYEPIQNSRIWEAVHTSLDGVNHTIQGSGYINGGSKIFIQTKVEDETFKVNGDDFSNYVTFFSSHDGSSSFELFDTSVRIICQNTLQPARSKGGKQFKLKVRHTSNASIRFEGVMKHLESIFQIRRQTYSKLNDLTTVGMNYNQLINWATSFFNRTNKLTTVSSTRAHVAKRLASHGTGNNGKTAYDMLNGVTELLTHGSPAKRRILCRNTDLSKIWRSSELGSGRDYKAMAVDHLHDGLQRQHHIIRGEILRYTGETSEAHLVG